MLIKRFIAIDEDRRDNWILGDRIGGGLHGSVFAVRRSGDTYNWGNGRPVMLEYGHEGPPPADRPYAMKTTVLEHPTCSLPEFNLEVTMNVIACKISEDHCARIYDAWVFDNVGYMIIDMDEEGTVPRISSLEEFNRLTQIWMTYSVKGIFHGDFKVTNILKNGRVIDWGVSISAHDLCEAYGSTKIQHRVRRGFREYQNKGSGRGERAFGFICDVVVDALESTQNEPRKLTRLINHLLYFEMLYRLAFCGTSRVQKTLIQSVIAPTMRWVRDHSRASKFKGCDVIISNKDFWVYFQGFVDFFRDMLWEMQLELIEGNMYTYVIKNNMVSEDPVEIVQFLRQNSTLRRIDKDGSTLLMYADRILRQEEEGAKRRRL